MLRHFISCLLLLTGITFSCTSCASRSMIAHGLAAREANEVVVLLVSKGISAEKTPIAASNVGGSSSEQLWDISVPSNQITEALSVLNQAGLPRPKGTSLLDLFSKQGLVPSELQEKIRYQEGLSEQMATTIRKMDGIIDANVQISFSQDCDEEHTPITASVYIKHRGVLDNPNSVVVSKIKRLVASAVPGLLVENVSVVGDRAIYSEINLNNPWGDETPLVSIWGMTLSQESIFKFRSIFYIFMILLFLTLSAIVWLIWKTHLLIGHFGGIKSMIQVAPYQYQKENKVTEEQKPSNETNPNVPEKQETNENSSENESESKNENDKKDESQLPKDQKDESQPQQKDQKDESQSQKE